MDAKLKEYIYGNIASLFWSLFLLVGGGIFISFYANIGYMPDFDFESSLTLLSAASITAILTLILLVVILIMPGFFWSNTWADRSSIKINWENEEAQKSFLKTALWFGAPILFFYGLLVLAFYSWVLAIFYGLLGVSISYFLVYKLSSLRGRLLCYEVCKMLGTSFVCSMLAFLPIYLVVTLSSSNIVTSKGSPAYIGVVVAFFIAFVNVLTTVKPRNINGLAYYFGLGVVALYIVLASFEVFHRIPERVMEIYKFGSINTKSIIFKSGACETLILHGLLAKNESKSQCVLENVKILSRLGSDMYLESKGLKITIKNSEVLSWSVQESSNKSIQPTAKASAD